MCYDSFYTVSRYREAAGFNTRPTSSAARAGQMLQQFITVHRTTVYLIDLLTHKVITNRSMVYLQYSCSDEFILKLISLLGLRSQDVYFGCIYYIQQTKCIYLPPVLARLPIPQTYGIYCILIHNLSVLLGSRNYLYQTI